MVALSEIKAFNATLGTSTKDLVAVVVGGTNGIGRAFLQQLAFKTANPTIYFLGRNPAVLETIQSELTSLNPAGTYIPIQAGDLTLLSSVEAAANQILQRESKIDILFQSQGFLTLAGRDESVEALDKITVVRYYGRTRFVVKLLPLLNAAPAPRVVSILAGGLEDKIFADDLHLRDPKNYGVGSAGGVSATYTTIAMEKLQKQNPKVSFVHMFPGLVRTNLFNSEHWRGVTGFVVNWMVFPVIGRLLAASPEEAGMRSLFAATSPKFASTGSNVAGKAVGSNGTTGSGVYTLDAKDDAQHNDKILKPIREQGLDDKIWEHTLEQYQRVLGKQ